MSTLRVIAVGAALVPLFDASGRMLRGRFVGRGHDGNASAETVADTPYHRTAIEHGDLALVADEGDRRDPA